MWRRRGVSGEQRQLRFALRRRLHRLRVTLLVDSARNSTAILALARPLVREELTHRGESLPLHLVKTLMRHPAELLDVTIRQRFLTGIEKTVAALEEFSVFRRQHAKHPSHLFVPAERLEWMFFTIVG